MHAWERKRSPLFLQWIQLKILGAARNVTRTWHAEWQFHFERIKRSMAAHPSGAPYMSQRDEHHYCNYCFFMFHSGCCTKYDVCRRNFHPWIKCQNYLYTYFFWYFKYWFVMLQLLFINVETNRPLRKIMIGPLDDSSVVLLYLY